MVGHPLHACHRSFPAYTLSSLRRTPGAPKAGGASLDVCKMLRKLFRRVLHGEAKRADLLDDVGGRSSANGSDRGSAVLGWNLEGSGHPDGMAAVVCRSLFSDWLTLSHSFVQVPCYSWKP